MLLILKFQHEDDPSGYEYALAQKPHDTSIPSYKLIVNSNVAQFTRKPKLLVTRTKQKLSFGSSLYISEMPIGFKPYVMHFNDVLGNGNYGFQVVAVGLRFGKEAWPQVRANTLSEL